MALCSVESFSFHPKRVGRSSQADLLYDRALLRSSQFTVPVHIPMAFAPALPLTSRLTLREAQKCGRDLLVSPVRRRRLVLRMQEPTKETHRGADLTARVMGAVLAQMVPSVALATDATGESLGIDDPRLLVVLGGVFLGIGALYLSWSSKQDDEDDFMGEYDPRRR